MASRVPNWLLVSGLALVGFTTVSGINLFRNDGLSELDRGDHSKLARKVYVKLDRKGDHTVRRAVPSTAHSLSQSPGGARNIERTRSHGVVEAEGPDLSVVGRPFPLSPSMKAKCRVDDGCAPELRLLKQFSQQPRDPVWAPKMEAGLRDLVMSQPGYSIRAIECRTSLCVAEVASGLGMFNFIATTGPYGSDPSLSSMHAVYPETAYEHDPTYATVTLVTFQRW